MAVNLKRRCAGTGLDSPPAPTTKVTLISCFLHRPRPVKPAQRCILNLNETCTYRRHPDPARPVSGVPGAALAVDLHAGGRGGCGTCRLGVRHPRREGRL